MKKRSLGKIKKAVSCLLCAALFSGSFSGLSVSAAEEEEKAAYQTDEIIIIYEDEAAELDETLEGISSGEQTLEDLGVTSQEELVSADSGQGAVTVASVSEGTDIEELIEELEADESIASVQPNYTYELFESETSDPYLSDDLTAEINQYYLYESSFTDAWELSKTEGEVTVAVLDTGANLLHEDLSENLDAEHAYDVTTGTLLSESGVSNNGDQNGHGTLVCGIIAAVTDNETGIAGAGYNAKVLPVKVFDSEDVCTTADLLCAYAYLASLIESGQADSLKVINLSLGYYTSEKSETDEALEEAILDMLDTYGVLTVCADGSASDGTYCYPADFEETISVAAVTAAGETASFSYIDKNTDLSAYGVNIYSTSSDGGYEAASGTSFAAPQVCAAIALILAADTALSAEEAADILIENASDQLCILDVYSALAAALGCEEEAEDDAEEEEVSEEEETLEIEKEASSWRYSNGSVISTPITDKDSSSSDITLFSSTYSTWKSSYGTSYYGIVSSSGTSKVSVSGAVRVGIDVSKYQGEIDWEKVAASGVTYAIIRCGYGSDYESQDDSYFLANVEGALDAGLEIGVYLYSYATKATGSAPSAESEAAHVLRLLEEAGLEPGDLDLPVFLDMEDSTQASLSASKLGDIAEAFCDAIEEEGYAVGIYANLNWWNNYLTDDAFDTESWYKWVARYPTSTSVKTSGLSDADMWQFTSHGSVSGVSGNVDVSFDYLGSGSYLPSQVTLSSVTLSSSLTSATVKWTAVSWADGYKIYRATGSGSYSLVKTITSGSTVSWTDSSLSLGKTYKYKVRPYKTITTTTVTYVEVASSDDDTEEDESSEDTSQDSSGDEDGTGTDTDADAGEDETAQDSSGDDTSTEGSSEESSSEDSSAEDGSSEDSSAEDSSSDEGSSDGSSSNVTYEEVITTTTSTYYGSYSAVKSVTTKPSTVTISSASTTTAGAVTVKWKKVSNATGYVIYRSTNGGSYKKVKTISSNSTVSWTDTSVVAGRVYRYKIQSYKKSGSTTAYSSSYSSVKKVTAKPAKVTISSVSSKKSRSGTVKWKKVSNATGYQVAYRRKGSSKWYYVTVKTNSKTFTSLRKKNYYVKVRAYTTYKGTKYYGSWSSEKAMKVK